MITKNVIALTAVAVLALTACANDPYGRSTGGLNKSDIGTVLGGVGGAVIGSNIGKGKGNVAAIAAGTLLGAALGNSIGRSLDESDLRAHNQYATQALETYPPGQALPWNNPQTGVSGTIVPNQYYQTQGGQYCREYTDTIMVGGRSEQSYGTACRQPDGSWQRVN